MNNLISELKVCQEVINDLVNNFYSYDTDKIGADLRMMEDVFHNWNKKFAADRIKQIRSVVKQFNKLTFTLAEPNYDNDAEKL